MKRGTVGILVALFVVCVATAIFTFRRGSQVEEKVVTIGFAGDTMLGRMANEVITAQGCSWVWGTVIRTLKATDVNIVNLETTLTTHKEPVLKVFNFKADSDKVSCLVDACVTCVNLANNHSLDFGNAGLLETLRVLSDAKIGVVGAGATAHEAAEPFIVTKKGIRIGVIGFTDNEPSWKAGPDKPGINYVVVGDIAPIKAAVDALRPRVDVLIVTIHWGPNMRQQPTQEFVNFAHSIIDCGVDVIHGHSAHIPQGIEIYHSKVILYDTGDFVDDYAIDDVLRNDQSCFFLVTVDRRGPRSIELVPTIISNVQVNCAVGRDYEEIMHRMRELSKPFGTTIGADGTIRIQGDESLNR